MLAAELRVHSSKAKDARRRIHYLAIQLLSHGYSNISMVVVVVCFPSPSIFFINFSLSLEQNLHLISFELQWGHFKMPKSSI